MSGWSVEPFQIAVPEDALLDLHRRLDETRWPDELPNVGWEYGVPLHYLSELVHHWRHLYDWRAAEARLNNWPQFMTEIDGATVHFAHIRSPEPGAMPLMMVHGWPSTFAEFGAVVGALSDPVSHGGDPADAFHLVLASVPGFGFSGPTRETGWHERRVSEAFAELMRRLGYDRYGTHGGDWGAAITRELGRTHPDQVVGVHLSLLVSGHATTEPSSEELACLSPSERQRTLASWASFQEWNRDRVGYGLLQATRPQTLAYALGDSPVGQLAWIAEKFHEWSDTRDPTHGIDRDALLDTASIYWFTTTAGSSARIYFERAHSKHWTEPIPPSRTPTAVAVFPEDNFIPLRHVGDLTNNIVRWTEFDRGGHFPALEQPELLTGDVRAFFRELRQP